MAYGATISSCVKFFPDKRGLIGGLTTAAYGLSSVILPPVAALLVDNFDVTKAFIIVGIVFIVLMTLSAIFVEQCSQGFVPEGWTPSSMKSGASNNDKDWKGMLPSPIFYVMMMLLCFGAFMGVFPGFAADQFGSKNNSVNFGIMFIGFAVAGYFGSTIMASTANDSKPYTNAFLIAAALNAVGIVLTFIYRAMKKKAN